MKKLLYLLPLAALLLSGCTSDGSPEASPSAEASDAIVLTASMGEGGATRGGQAIQATAFDEGELIGVEVTPTGGSMQSSVYRAGAANEGHNPLTAYSRAITWPANNGMVAIRAYYPSTVGSSTTSFTVQADQSEDDDYKLSDLMYAEAVDDQPKVASVPLTFHHALSKIVINLVAGTNVDDDVLAQCVVAVKACPTATITGGVATPVADGTAADDYGYITIGTGAATAGIIVPQTLPGSSVAPLPLIRVSLGDKNLYFKLRSSKTFEARKMYTYNLQVALGDVILLSAYMQDWNTVNRELNFTEN